MKSKHPDVLVTATLPSPLSDRFSGREAFENLVRRAFVDAAREGWQEIILSDASFEDWPLHERAVVDSLHAWAGSGRRMILLASSYDAVIRNQARFVSWRKTWGHILDCRVCRTVSPADLPSVIWSRNWYMHRQDFSRSIGASGCNPERLRRIREMLDEKIRISSPGFVISTLGL